MATTDQPGNDQEPGTDPEAQANRLLTPGEVAAICGGKTTGETVVRRHKHWGLQAVKVGRELRFWQREVYDWIEKHRD